MTIVYGCLGSLLILVGGVALLVLGIRKRPSMEYPDPLSLIIQPENVSESDQLRILSFEGVANFRDLGGYRTADGRKVKWHTVFRSGKWSNPDPLDLRKLADLGIHAVCDLRSDWEVTGHPDRLPDQITYKHLVINDDISNWQRLISLIWDRSRMPQQITQIYRVFIDNNPGVFGGMLRLLADADNLPAVIHCNAGKDRAGLASALLLLALGVPEETVVADYTLSNYDYAHFRTLVARRVSRLRFLNITVDDLYPLITANAHVLQATIAHIKTTYGSVHNYLTGPAGLDEVTLKRLRDNLLE